MTGPTVVNAAHRLAAEDAGEREEAEAPVKAASEAGVPPSTVR